MAKNYYDILGVDKNASESEIRKAFLKKSKECHPDTQVGKSNDERKVAEERFKEINEAYQTLSDKNKRAQYDMYGSGDFEGSGMNMDDLFKGFGFGSMFDNFAFGGFGSRKGTINKGRNASVTLNINLRDIYNETVKSFTYTRQVPCETCKGTGNKDCQEHKCTHCHGTGMIHNTVMRGSVIQDSITPCQYCNGSGKDKSHEKCPTCGGTGTKVVTETASIKLGVQLLVQGGNAMVAGYGDIPSGANPIPGDLLITTVLDNSDGYGVDAHLNVQKTVEVPLIDCILGKTIKVECLDGKTISIKLKEGTVDGETYRIPNKGFKHMNGTTDMCVIIRHKIPSSVTDEERKLLEKLRKQPNFS